MADYRTERKKKNKKTNPEGLFEKLAIIYIYKSYSVFSFNPN